MTFLHNTLRLRRRKKVSISGRQPFRKVISTQVSAIALLTLAGCSTSGSESAERELGARPVPVITPARPAPVRGSKNFFEARSAQSECYGSPSLRDLAVAKFGLSNRDMESSIAMLSAMGYSFIGADNPNPRISCQALPAILFPVGLDGDRMMASTADSGPYAGAGNLNIAPLPKVNSVDLDELVVFFHPGQQAELQRLEAAIEQIVDTASPQVYIETMVLEVSEETSRDLGISYTTGNIGTNNLLSLGSLEPGDGDTVNFRRNTRRNADGEFEFLPDVGIEAEIRALVANNEAEILASPSVMALSNRQAVIQIVDVVQTPIVQSAIGGSGELLISGYTFEPLLLGITLNLRPRVSADRRWVSLEIDATVESELDENSGTVFAPDGEGGRIALAEKKGSASRKVKTVARIPDRTPIVIGGLVAGNKEEERERIPLLGEIPILGALFGATDTEIQKREIVIVLTPHVLAEDAIGVRGQTATADVLERSARFRIFNGEYTLLASDVYDMGFIEQDPEFRRYVGRAAALIRERPSLATDRQLRRLADGQIPGESAIVARTIYDVIPLPDSERQRWLEDVRVPIGAGETTTLAALLDGGFSPDDALAIKCEAIAGGGCVFRTTRLGPGDARDGYDFVIQRETDVAHLLRVIATDATISKNGGYEALEGLKPGDSFQLPRSWNADTYTLSDSTLRVAAQVDDMVAIVRDAVALTFRDVDRLALASE